MAVLPEDEYFNTVQRIFEGKQDKESIQDFENLIDTFSDLKKQSTSQDDWKEKYNQLDAEWRARYINRFNNGDFGAPTVQNGLPFDPAHPVIPAQSGKPDPEKITFDDLFTSNK